MPRPSTIPAFAGSREEILDRTMQWVHANVRRHLPGVDWIRDRFLQRTVGEVVADGFTLAYAPCVDRSLVTAAILGEHGIEPYVLLHDSPTGTWHLVLEVPNEDGGWVWADYGTHESHLFPGRYQYARVPGKVPRLLRMKGPKAGPAIWDARPPLRFLAGMGVDLRGRFGRFTEELSDYERDVERDGFSLADRLVRDREQSRYAELWRTNEAVGFGDPEVQSIDLSDVHLYLERRPRTPAAERERRP